MTRRQRLQRTLLVNPITLKELRGRMRGRRAFVVLTLYLFFMGAIISLVYLGMVSSNPGPSGVGLREAGKAIFGVVLSMQVFLVIFIGPAFTAGAISGEKERQTYDLLRTTLLSPRAFVTGKLLSALSYVLLLLLASIPLQSIAFWLGGLSPGELIISQLVVLMGALTFALWGLYCSTALRSTLAASVTTFAGALFVTAGVPLLVLLLALVLSPLMIGLSGLSGIAEALLQYGGLLLAAANLPATLIVSELILASNNSYFLFQQSVGGRMFWFISPWPIFLLLYGLLALLLFWLTVRRVRRIDD